MLCYVINCFRNVTIDECLNYLKLKSVSNNDYIIKIQIIKSEFSVNIGNCVQHKNVS